MFLTQQCLNQELTLDLLEKFRHPEKLKSSLVTEDDEMEVLTRFLLTLYFDKLFIEMKSLVTQYESVFSLKQNICSIFTVDEFA